MADGRCLNADILASLLLGNNEAFAKEVVELTNRLNAAKIMSSRGNKTVAKNIEKNVRMQINGIVSSRILMGDAWKEAKESLMKTIRHKWWTIWEWAKLLELIDWISLANADEYAWLLFKEWVDTGTKKEAIDWFKKAIADFVASKNQLNKNFWTKISAKAKGIKDRVKFIWELWKTEKKQAKAAKKKWEKAIPKEVLSPDETWKSIVNLMESDKKDSEILFNNYVLWRIFLWEDEDILVDFLRVEWNFNNTMPTLTIDDVKWFKTIDSLIERVYTNALDIARNKDLRKELKLKLLELIQWQNWTKANQYKRAINVINTLMFADTWVSFSTTLKYSNIWWAIREVLVNDNWLSRVSDSISNESLYEELKELLERDKLLLWDKDNPRHIEAFWTKITWEELLKIIYAASWDESVKAAIELAWDVPDDVIIKFAWAKLFWINQKQWEKNMRDLLKNFRKPYNVTEVSSIAFKATSWRNVVPTNNTSIAFFNFNKAENALNANIENSTLLSRARFNDDLSNLYTLTVTTDTIPSYDISDWIEWLSDDILKNIEYIVLPNGNRRNDYRLTRLKERLKSLWNNKYQIIYPKSRQSWQYFVDVDWRLKFKTTSERLYNEMSNKLAIESLNSATVDLTENTSINRQLINLSNEQKKQALNNSAMDFFRHYMGTAWEWLSDEQLIKRISEMTWIPINDAWTTNWELAQRVLYNNYTATWRYSKQVVTEADIDNILKEIDSYNEADIIKALKDDGFIIDENIVKKNTSIIKEAYKNLRTTWDLTEYLWYKWVVNWLSNKNSVTDIWTIEFQKILTSPNPREELAKYLYWDRVLSKSEFESVEDYLWDILDSFTSKMVDNLTKDWYQIPMISPRRAMMEYLRWNVSVSNEFIDAFIYKNWLDADYNVIKQIFDDHLPNEIEIKWVISADTLKNMRTPNNWLVVKELSPEERFLPTTYNSYSAVLEQMNLPKEKFPNSITDDAVYLNEDEVREIVWRFFTPEELKEVEINFSDELIDWIADWRYGRDWMRRFLDFIRNPEELTPYHETVHMYLDMFVSDEDKINLLDTIWKENQKEIQKYIRDNKIRQENFFRTPEEAQRSKFSFFNKVTEERVADNFIKFVKDQDIKLKKKTKNIFQKIWDFLTSWWKDRTEEQLDALNQLYSDIYNRVRPEGGIIRREWDANYYQSAFHRTRRRPTVEDYDIAPIRDTDWRQLFRTYINRNLFTRWELAIDRVAKDWIVNLNDLSSEISTLKKDSRISNYEYEILKWKIEDCRRDTTLWLDVPREIFDETLWEWKRDYPVITARGEEWFATYWKRTDRKSGPDDMESRLYVIRKLEDVSQWRYEDAADYRHFPVTTETYSWRYPESLFHARHEEIIDSKWPQIYRIKEIQSDTFQHSSSYRDAIAAFWWNKEALEELNAKRAKKGLPLLKMLPKTKRISEEEFRLMKETWADRAMSEEINNAINNWFNKVQFPYYWTITELEWFTDLQVRTPQPEVPGRPQNRFSRLWEWTVPHWYLNIPSELLWRRWERPERFFSEIDAYRLWDGWYYYVADSISNQGNWLYRGAGPIFNDYISWPWRKLLEDGYNYTEDDIELMRSILRWWNRPSEASREKIIEEFKKLLKEHPNTYSSEWDDMLYMNDHMKRIAQETFDPFYWSKDRKIWEIESALEDLGDWTYKLKDYVYYFVPWWIRWVSPDYDTIILKQDTLENRLAANENIPTNYSIPKVDDNADELTKKDIDEYIASNQKNFDKIRTSLLWLRPMKDTLDGTLEWKRKYIWWFISNFEKSSEKIRDRVTNFKSISSNPTDIKRWQNVSATIINEVEDTYSYIKKVVKDEWWIDKLNERIATNLIEKIDDSVNKDLPDFLKHTAIVKKYTEDYIPRFQKLVKDMFWKDTYIEKWDYGMDWITLDLKDIDPKKAPYIAYHRARRSVMGDTEKRKIWDSSGRQPVYAEYPNRNLFTKWELIIDRLDNNWKINLNTLKWEINRKLEERRLSQYEHQIIQDTIKKCRESMKWENVDSSIFYEVLWQYKREMPVVYAWDKAFYAKYHSEDRTPADKYESRVYTLRPLDDLREWRYKDAAPATHFRVNWRRLPETVFHARHDEKNWVYRIVEIQSDLFQHNEWYRNAKVAFWWSKREIDKQLNGNRLVDGLPLLSVLPKSERMSDEERWLIKQTRVDRVIIEEINNAIDKWFKIIQFPADSTVKVTEWYGEMRWWWASGKDWLNRVEIRWVWSAVNNVPVKLFSNSDALFQWWELWYWVNLWQWKVLWVWDYVFRDFENIADNVDLVYAILKGPWLNLAKKEDLTKEEKFFMAKVARANPNYDRFTDEIGLGDWRYVQWEDLDRYVYWRTDDSTNLRDAYQYVIDNMDAESFRSWIWDAFYLEPVTTDLEEWKYMYDLVKKWEVDWLKDYLDESAISKIEKTADWKYIAKEPFSFQELEWIYRVPAWAELSLASMDEIEKLAKKSADETYKLVSKDNKTYKKWINMLSSVLSKTRNKQWKIIKWWKSAELASLGVVDEWKKNKSKVKAIIDELDMSESPAKESLRKDLLRRYSMIDDAIVGYLWNDLDNISKEQILDGYKKWLPQKLDEIWKDNAGTINSAYAWHINVVSNYYDTYIPKFKTAVKELFWEDASIVESYDWVEWIQVDLSNMTKEEIDEIPYIAYHRVRNDRTKNIWNPALTEDNVIEDILNKYEKAVEKWISGKEKMTVKESQDLKQQASYALNTAVQDLILSRYWSILNASDREWLLWLWYNLKLASNKDELEILKEANRQTMANFRRRWWEVAQQYNTLLRNPEELDKRLMESWRVYTERNWQQAIVDVREELENSIKSIPDTAWEITALKQMDSKNIRWLKPKQAYTLLKTIDLVKNNITRWNFYTQLMYQLNPQLRQAENWLNFFQTFKVVDMWWWVWVPWSLTNNATAWYVQAWKSVADASDLTYKADITKAIYNWYIKIGKELTQKDLENIVGEVLKWTMDTEYAQHYIDAFAPYVSLKWLSPDVVTYVNNLLNTESKEVQGLLKEVWADLDSILDMNVILDDGSSVRVWDMINWNVNWWQERLFWWLSNNGEEKFFISKDRASNVKEEIKSAYSWYNWVDLVTQNEAHVITSLFWNARKILQRDTNTKKFIEFDNSIWWQNDILKQLMELHLFWWWKYWKDATWIQRTINWLSKIYSTWVNSRWWFDPKRWWEVQLLYETYYSRSLEELKNMPLPEGWTHQIALELAKYFKELEMRLGSKTWATWVSIDTSVNRAFWNLWSIVRNIHTDKWVYSLMNKIGNNQVLWLFKFTKKWDAAYNDFLYKLSTDNIWWAASTTYAYNYKEFVNWDMEEIARQFNTMFGSNFSKSDVNIILQWLGWYQIVNQKWNRWVRIISNYISWFWWRTARLLMTYPYQLFTIYNQVFAYNVKANAFKRELWVENVGHTNDIRKELWILEWTYVDFDWLMNWIRRWVSVPVRAIWEVVPDKAKNFMLDVIWRDSDEVAKAWIEFDDWIMWLYWKTTSYVSNNYDIIKMSQLFDSVKDNANNIIDAAHSQTFKWLAFLKALQKNDYIQFMNADAFKAFMARTDISQAVKDKLLDRVNIYSNRIFQDMLGIWFSWLDKVYWWNALTDFLSWVLWTINFKWAWGTNIFRQTFEKLGSLLKVWIEYAKWNKATADEMWAYIVRTPEFSNLSTCLWWDLVMSWKMARFAKNWQLPDDESEVELMDYVWWVKDNIWFISQQWQWLQSFWWMRPFTEAIRWVYYNMDKWPLWALWAWNNAFWATLASNVWRNWKPVTFIADALLIAETDWIDAAWKFVEDNWHTISAWTMRYMVEEWYNAYWVNNALTVQRWWIPALLVWEQYANSDTAFMYDVNKWTSSWLQLLSNAINTSQFFKLWKVLVQWAVQWWYKLMWEEAPDWTKSKKWVYNLMSIKDDLNESQTFRELWDTWKPMPKTQKQLQNLLDDYMKPNYPGWYKAYVWLQNYIETWTLNGRWWDEWNYYDKGLEQFYKKIEEQNPWELKDFLERFTTAYLWDPNSEQARIDFYNWAREWLNRMEWDPDYNLYASAMFKWHLNNLYYEVLDKEAEIYSWERTGMWYDKAQTKVSREDINKMKNVKQRINERFLAQHYDEMYAADMELMQHNFYQWIADELEPEVANGYFTQQKKKDWENKETDELEWVLKGNIKNQIQDEIFFEKAIKDWRWEDALTYASIMTQSLAYDDETWETRAAMCDYYADRIINSDWPATVKQSALAWLIHNNEPVFTYDWELAEKYGDYYDAATQYKNEVLHNTNERVINNMNNLAIALHEDTTETTKTARSWVNLSNLISKLSWSLESSQVGKVQYNPKKPDNKFLAIPIKWLSAMWYKSPKKPAGFNFEVVYKSQGYDPKTKTLWPITPPKINKAVKSKSTRKMTQKEENELDLI